MSVTFWDSHIHPVSLANDGSSVDDLARVTKGHSGFSHSW